MNEKDFMDKIKKILDNDEVALDSALADIEEWDSLSIVSFAAMANASGKSLTLEQIRRCLSVRDLYALLQ